MKLLKITKFNPIPIVRRTLLICFVCFGARADDVYNFYFQKAPGPTTVIQGGSEKTQERSLGKSTNAEAMNDAMVQGVSSVPAVNSVTPSVGTNALQASVAHDSGVKGNLKNWEINFGSSFVADRAGKWKGETLGLQYNFSQYFGLQFGLTRTIQAENRNYGPSSNWQDPFDIYLGGILTPITIHTFSHSLISISGLGGLMTSRDRIWADYDSQISRAMKGNGQNRETRGYVGAQVALNFADSFAILAQGRVVPDDKSFGHAMVGAVVRF